MPATSKTAADFVGSEQSQSSQKPGKAVAKKSADRESGSKQKNSSKQRAEKSSSKRSKRTISKSGRSSANANKTKPTRASSSSSKNSSSKKTTKKRSTSTKRVKRSVKSKKTAKSEKTISKQANSKKINNQKNNTTSMNDKTQTKSTNDSSRTNGNGQSGEQSPDNKNANGNGAGANGSSTRDHLDQIPDGNLPTQVIEGVLDTARNGHGVLRIKYSGTEKDAYISSSQIKRFNLRSGDEVVGPARRPKENERYWGLLQIDEINGTPAEKFRHLNRPRFKQLTPVYPDEQIKLETGKNPLSLRIIDMVAPIGKGQRSLIVSPPKAGKTTLLKDIATGVAKNEPDIHLMAVLVGERPEEVTDIRRHMEKITKGDAEVAASNFDESAEDQCQVAELALARAKRLVEMGENVMILLDSITRLARAYNLSMPTSGRTLSGGFDPAALFPPKRFFGAARNFEDKGSLTIVGSALVDTGSRMDDLIYEEFKGTGNQEIHLDRRMAERRIYPAIDVQRSGTRKDELLLDSVTYQSIVTLQRMLDTLDREERTSTLINRLKRTDSNKEFLAQLKTA